MLVLAGVVYFVLVGWGNGLKIFIAAKSSVCYASKAELRLDVPGEVSRKSLLHGKTFFFCLCFTRWMTGRPHGQEKLWQGLLLLQGLTLGKCHPAGSNVKAPASCVRIPKCEFSFARVWGRHALYILAFHVTCSCSVPTFLMFFQVFAVQRL